MNRRSVPSTFMIPMFEDLVSPFTTAWAKAIDCPSGENAGRPSKVVTPFTPPCLSVVNRFSPEPFGSTVQSMSTLSSVPPCTLRMKTMRFPSGDRSGPASRLCRRV